MEQCATRRRLEIKIVIYLPCPCLGQRIGPDRRHRRDSVLVLSNSSGCTYLEQKDDVKHYQNPIISPEPWNLRILEIL